MGGMAVLEWPLCTPNGYIRHIIPIATSARHSASASASKILLPKFSTFPTDGVYPGERRNARVSTVIQATKADFTLPSRPRGFPPRA